MRIKFRRPSAPTVISLLALFVALGGSATAGVMITKSSQLGKNVVTGAKIKKGSVSSSKLSKSAKAQLRGVGLRGLAGDKGAVGATGSKGPQGDPGVDGQAGLAGAKGEAGDKGQTGDKGETGDKGPQGDIGPSAIALVGRIEINNEGIQLCKWKQPNGYLVPEGESPPTLSWEQAGICKLQFAPGSNVKWATAEATSSTTSWSKVGVNTVSDFVYVSLYDFPDTYGDAPVASQGTAYVVVYRDSQ